MSMYVSQLRAVPIGMYEYYIYLVDASARAAHSGEIANALQDLAVQSGTDAVVVRGPRDLSFELHQFLQEHAPSDFGRLWNLFHEVSSLVISEGALQTTTSQVFVLPLIPGRADGASHAEVLAKLVAGLLDAMRRRRVGEFCISLGAEHMRLSALRDGLLVATLRRLNEALEAQAKPCWTRRQPQRHHRANPSPGGAPPSRMISEPPNNTFDRTAGSHSLAAAGQRERSAAAECAAPGAAEV